MWFINKKATKPICLALLVALFGLALFSHITQAATGINQQVSFQGKLVNANGTNVADGTYNLQFKIYQDGNGCVAGSGSSTAPCGGTLKWTESRLVSNTQGVVVSAGTFQVNLGSVNALTGVDFNQDSLWLSMNVGGTNNTATPTYDGEMTPFIRLTAVPYALNAGTVGGIAASDLVRLSGGQQTGTVNISGNITSGGTLQASTLDTVASGVLTVGSTNTTGITLGKNVTVTSGQTLSVGGQTVFSGTGILQSAAFSGTYSNAVTLSNTSNSIAGTFSGNTIAAQYGGTGNNSYAIGDLLYASGTTALAKLNAVAAGSCLKSNGVGAAPVYGSCGGSTPTLQSAYDGGKTITQTAAGTISFSTGTTVPTADQLIIDNTGSTGVTTAGVNAVNVKYKGGAAAIEGSGMRIDFAPGSTTGGTWNGLRIVADPTGPATGVNAYGIKLDGPTTQGNGMETGVYVGTGWDIGIDVGSGGIQLAAETNDPPTPAAGELRLYAKTIAGRVLPKWIGPSGVDTPVQANFGFNRIMMSAPAGNTNSAVGTFSAFGSTNAGAGTFSAPALTTGSLLNSTRRSRITSAATANSTAYINSGMASMWRGNGSGLGGYYFTTRFALSTTPSTTNRFFVGLSDNLAPAIADMTTSNAMGKLGIAVSAAGNLKWVNNPTGTASTPVDLGASFPANTTNLYELIIFSPPNSTNTITYRVKNLSTNVATSDTVVSTNNPTNTTWMSPLIWTATTNTTAAAIDTAGWYVESDN